MMIRYAQITRRPLSEVNLITLHLETYLAVLGGAEAIVVGGGIGENTPAIRERIFEGLDWCGAVLDR